MGRKLDALLGRTSKTKFKTLANLAISRITILKNQRQVRCSHARSDVIQLLNLGQQERALLRVEHVIKEQNMLDVFVMIEGYCHILIERAILIRNNRECPDEIKEAASSLLFASSRCGEFPELQQIRKIFTSQFGREFSDHATELRNNCGVNPKIIQKLSAQQPSLESRMKVLKEIASDNKITLKLKEEETKQKPLEPFKSPSLDNSVKRYDTKYLSEETKPEERFSESVKARKYKDVAAAAQEAFESAAYAAAAARAAVELSRSESQDLDPDDHYDSNHGQGIVFDSEGSSKAKLYINNYASSEESNHSNTRFSFEKLHSVDNFGPESETEEILENNYTTHPKESRRKTTLYASSSDSDGDILGDRIMPLNQRDQSGLLSKAIGFDRNYETGKENTPWFHHDLVSDRKSSLQTIEFSKIRQFRAVADEDLSYDNGNESPLRSPKQVQSRHSGVDRKPVSARTRKVQKG